MGPWTMKLETTWFVHMLHRRSVAIWALSKHQKPTDIQCICIDQSLLFTINDLLVCYLGCPLPDSVKYLNCGQSGSNPAGEWERDIFQWTFWSPCYHLRCCAYLSQGSFTAKYRICCRCISKSSDCCRRFEKDPDCSSEFDCQCSWVSLILTWWIPWLTVSL